jgi:NADH:ubiquinone oxidoreductase subunit 6 (subunit J)
LFLFVVMMLNIKLVEWTESLTRFVPITLVIGLIFLSQATTLLDNFSNTNLLATIKSLETPTAVAEGNLSGLARVGESHLGQAQWLSVQIIDWVRSFINFTNAEILGQFLYTDFSYLFLLSSMVLLVAMIGAIILSLDHHRQIKRQDLYSQISTKSTISLIDPVLSKTK